MQRSPSREPRPPKRYLERLLVDPDELPDGPHAFSVYAERTTVRLISALAVFGCALSVLFWPMDFVVFAADPRRLRIAFGWRAAVVLATACLLLLTRSLHDGRWRPRLTLTLFFYALTSLTFATASWMGGPTTPWLYVLYAVPLFTTMMLVRLLERTLIVYGGLAIALLTYFAIHPEHGHDPFLPAFLGVLGGVSMLFVGVGHMLYAVIRTAFEQRQELRRLSRTDPLTGVSNHGHLRAIATHEIARARRTGSALSLLMIDVDHFKPVNDAFGHAVGDAVLTELAALLLRTVREIDQVGRMGGEEFAIVLPNTQRATAIEVAERVRQAVEGTASFSIHAPVRCTISLGCAELAPDDDTDALLRRADQALYDAKQQGRNRVVAR
ncbi:MAG: GGDEF domain-containing protein [bacterium]